MKLVSTYTPAWENRHVQKRLTKVLNWACEFIPSNRGTILPIRLSSVHLSKVFGPSGNQLGDYLRDVLLECTNQSYSTEKKYCKEYRIKKSGYQRLTEIEKAKKDNLTQQASSIAYVDTNPDLSLRERKKDNLTQQASSIAYVDTSLSRLESLFADEIANLTFKMSDKENRLWHRLQNLKKQYKTEFWAGKLDFNYDISACAPTVLYQMALHAGVPKIVLEHISVYVDTKQHLRKRVSELTSLSIEDSKRLINSLFNGARLAKNKRCSAYKLLDYDEKRLESLAADEEIRALRADIKKCWAGIKNHIQLNHNLFFDTRSSKVKWNLYFQAERRILDAVIKYLKMHDIKYFTEHDGWRCSKELDIQELQEFIFKETKFNLKIERQEEV